MHEPCYVSRAVYTFPSGRYGTMVGENTASERARRQSRCAVYGRSLVGRSIDELFDNECIHFQCLLKTLKDPPTTLCQMSLFLKKN